MTQTLLPGVTGVLALADGTIRPATVTSYAMADAAKAQTDMEERKTKGSVVLLP